MLILPVFDSVIEFAIHGKHNASVPERHMRIVPTKDYGDTNFITGVRAFAALAVVVIHSGGAGLRNLGQWGNSLADLGRTGPYVFFVVSGYSVALSFSQSNGFLEYIYKRLWRIAPLYYFWLAFAFVFCDGWGYWQRVYNARFDASNVLLHGSFLSFLDYRIANSFIGVEWSIPIEVFWYFLLPCLIFLIRGKLSAIVAPPLCLVGYFLMMNAALHWAHGNQDAVNAIHWSPIPYFLCYAAGISAYRLRPLIPRSPRAGDAVLLCSIAAILLYAASPGAADKVLFDDCVFMTLITFSLILFGSGKSTLCNFLLTNKPVLYLGTISYGLYLCHILLLDYFARVNFAFLGSPAAIFLVLSVFSTIVSSCTYFLIERPALSVSKRLKQRFWGSQKAAEFA
jgi:peptidoglycan/LPS O-acetylase OafA/YrhL